jgi:thiol-disulfide isomerase/thioredoxin
MSKKSSAGRAPAGRTAQRPAPRGGSRPGPWLMVGLFVVVVGVMVGVRLMARATPSGAGQIGAPVPQAVEARLTSPLTSGSPSLATPPQLVHRRPLWTEQGKPVLLYVGAEYCPYCATLRWPLVVALRRFGTLSHLKYMRSTSADVYPDTPTLSFYGATYRSPYLQLEAVEQAGRNPVGGQFPPLMKLTPAETAHYLALDGPPYLPASQAGDIPFLDLADRFLWIGAPFDPTYLRGLSWSQVIADLNQPSSPVGQRVAAQANLLSAAICSLDGQRPVAVCRSPGVLAASRRLPKGS